MNQHCEFTRDDGGEAVECRAEPAGTVCQKFACVDHLDEAQKHGAPMIFRWEKMAPPGLYQDPATGIIHGVCPEATELGADWDAFMNVFDTVSGPRWAMVRTTGSTGEFEWVEPPI